MGDLSESLRQVLDARLNPDGAKSYVIRDYCVDFKEFWVDGSVPSKTLLAETAGSDKKSLVVVWQEQPPDTGPAKISASHSARLGTGIDAVGWCARMAELGAGEILLTSMDRDGTRDGFDLELTRAVADRVPIPVIASGGVGSLEHLYQGVVAGGADAVLAASIFHFGEFTVGQARDYLRDRGVPVRE
jgi:hypothetical protein